MHRISIEYINQMPTTVGGALSRFDKDVAPEPGKCHESLLRAWNILDRVKWLLREGSSAPVILQEIAEMEQPK